MAESGTITDQMFREIVNADVCVALLTGFNPNVFYELAVAQAAARPLVILIEKGQSLPFDVKDLRCIEYETVSMSRMVHGTYADRWRRCSKISSDKAGRRGTCLRSALYFRRTLCRAFCSSQKLGDLANS